LLYFRFFVFCGFYLGYLYIFIIYSIFKF